VSEEDDRNTFLVKNEQPMQQQHHVKNFSLRNKPESVIRVHYFSNTKFKSRRTKKKESNTFWLVSLMLIDMSNIRLIIIENRLMTHFSWAGAEQVGV
jgi:hypothetical protein